MKKSIVALAFILVMMSGAGRLAAVDTVDTKLLTQPAVSADRVAFVYANDLWTADLEGRNVRRLTSGVGVEMLPAFSPDGSLVAFSGQYDGNTDVFVVPAGGGVPRRLTWHPAADLVQGFTPDGTAVLFTSSRFSSNRAYSQLFTVPVKGGEAGMLKIPYASNAEFSPDGRFIAYNPFPEAFTQWKNYRGGRYLADLDLQRPGLRHREGAPARGALERCRPDVVRKDRPLPIRPERRVQPLLLRPRVQGGQAADRLQGFPGPLRFGRGRPDRLRAGRLAPPL